ncbi:MULTISPECIES: LLM class flavin-dependent oxidoreductase [Aequorivita]|uniref:LLM class flavin-dependent oxidoreductase n=1 Tax=Aequorivita iocasae TaxID=2803865 RepID=A0ABX7DWT7_9FLAO|nr:MULTISPECIES: LLM class flavin-dependent oxidoreductase [Aequorivita]QQX78091.1 LLM class flavin-dependent oxidoreductase [Aequorivita iocasae]UCA57600.1 LLM class flavin-dependent oxidoreductase [Aequorivita sp. F7]
MNKEENLKHTPFSILDLVPVMQGSTHKVAMENSLALAQHAEDFGYKRFWISEHHNAESLVSSATSLLIGYVAQGTKSIRVGSGGVMLPNHAPLVIAEQFGTLATLYPNRIDLGLGRAPGTDQLTARALRRDRQETVNDFPQDVQELERYFSKNINKNAVRAIPGEGLEVPLYLLGSSTYSAQLAGSLGLPYAFASHFAPTHLHDALLLYHSNFEASKQLIKPYAMACVNIVVADTDEEAEYLATSMKLFMLNVIRNTRQPLPPPVKSMDGLWNSMEEAHISHMMQYTFIGSKETVQKKILAFLTETSVNEIIAVAHIYDQIARLRSFELLSQINANIGS